MPRPSRLLTSYFCLLLRRKSANSLLRLDLGIATQTPHNPTHAGHSRRWPNASFTRGLTPLCDEPIDLHGGNGHAHYATQEIQRSSAANQSFSSPSWVCSI